MTELSPSAIVGDIAGTLPGAAEVFRRNGISFCCGGTLSLSEAAAKQGLAVEAVLDELRALAAGARSDAPAETPGRRSESLSRQGKPSRRSAQQS